MPLIFQPPPHHSVSSSSNWIATAGRDVYRNGNGHPYARGLVAGGRFTESDAVALHEAAGTTAASARAPRTSATTPDPLMMRDLRAAAATGRGVTVAELSTIVRRHEADGPGGALTTTERAAIRAAIDEDMFSSSTGVDRARALVAG